MSRHGALVNPPFLNQREDLGICPKCKSDETVSSKARLRRMCLKCGFQEELEDYEQALIGWLPNRRSAPKPKSTVVLKNVDKIIESIEPRITRITVPTACRDDFHGYLTRHKVQIERPVKTDVWNNVESAYTKFELIAAYEVAEQIFDEWVAGSNES